MISDKVVYKIYDYLWLLTKWFIRFMITDKTFLNSDGSDAEKRLEAELELINFL